MSALLNFLDHDSITQDILLHPAWHGEMRGLDAEKRLRGKKTPYLYLLRAGETTSENVTDYYVTFISRDLSVRHQAFIITTTGEGWYFENGGNGGPYQSGSIEDVLHLIMHCGKGECVPLPMIG
jgi:hypothetical protein